MTWIGGSCAAQLLIDLPDRPKVPELLGQIARKCSKAKVSKLFLQLFAPIPGVHRESCKKSLETLAFFATFGSHKNRCKSVRPRPNDFILLVDEHRMSCCLYFQVLPFPEIAMGNTLLWGDPPFQHSMLRSSPLCGVDLSTDTNDLTRPPI